jgi:hypothetical protein
LEGYGLKNENIINVHSNGISLALVAIGIVGITW